MAQGKTTISSGCGTPRSCSVSSISARLSISGGSVWSQPSGSRRLGRPHDASVPAVSDEGRPCDCGGTYLTYGRADQGRRSPNSSLKPIPTARAAPGVRHPRTRNRKRYRPRSRSTLLDSGVRSRSCGIGLQGAEHAKMFTVAESVSFDILGSRRRRDGPRPDPGGKSSRSFRRPARESSRPRCGLCPSSAAPHRFAEKIGGGAEKGFRSGEVRPSPASRAASRRDRFAPGCVHRRASRSRISISGGSVCADPAGRLTPHPEMPV